MKKRLDPGYTFPEGQEKALRHCVVALDEHGNTMGRPLNLGHRDPYTYNLGLAMKVSGEFTEYVIERGLSIGIPGLRGRYHKPAGFEIVSEIVRKPNE